jgi:hypothetical protein
MITCKSAAGLRTLPLHIEPVSVKHPRSDRGYRPDANGSRVTVPAGATSASFPVSTKPVSSDTNVTLIDAYGGQNRFANLSVRVS